MVEAIMAREVGVDGLDDLVIEGNVGLADGVEDLEGAGDGPRDDEILLLLFVEEPSPVIAA